MKELEERIINELRDKGDEYSINDLNRVLHCRKENLIQSVKRLEKDNYVKIRIIGNKKMVRINHDQKLSFDLFYYVLNIKKHIKNQTRILQELKQSGQPLEQINENKVYFLNSESKQHLDTIVYLLNSLNNLSASYSYLNYFIPEKHSEIKIKKIQKSCIDFTKKTINNIVKTHHKQLLKNYIYLNIFRPEELQRLENYFKSQK